MYNDVCEKIAESEELESALSVDAVGYWDRERGESSHERRRRWAEMERFVSGGCGGVVGAAATTSWSSSGSPTPNRVPTAAEVTRG